MEKIAVVTALKPDPYNGGGGPSGIIYEVATWLEHTGTQVDVYHIPPATGLRRRLNLYGIGYSGRWEHAADYQTILVYPENLLFYIPESARHKCIVLGPDSPSLRDARLFKMAPRGVFRLYRHILYLLCLWHEYRTVKSCRKMLVVGRTDSLWMRVFNRRILRSTGLVGKVMFLHHPFLTKVIPSSDKLCAATEAPRRFIFAGLINERYQRPFIDRVLAGLAVLTTDTIRLVVLGKRNRWLAELASSYTGIQVDFIEWIEDYNDVCHIGADVHCLTDIVGAGTKNRALTALASGVEVIATPIGIENIAHHGTAGLTIAATPERFAKTIAKLNKTKLSAVELDSLIKSRLAMRERTHQLYDSDMSAVFDDISYVN